MSYTFHILGIPHTVSTPEYSSCAFTGKVVKLCKLLKARGHRVIHYGHEDSQVACFEHVTVTTRADLEQSYPGHDWREKGWPEFKLTDHSYRVFYANAIAKLHLYKQRGDFLMCSFGDGHKPVYLAHPDMIAVEPGIGYPGGCFAPFRVFESYAMLHAHYGMPWVQTMSNDHWYDAVIPNYFDLDEFDFSAEKDDFLLALGRVGPGKGTNIAIQVAEATGDRLVIAGAGGLNGSEQRTTKPLSEFVELRGVVGPPERRRLLARAKAVLTPSTFAEPMCGVQVEAMLSGTPVISTDFGAFAEYNLHGITGWRCRTFEQFVWAAQHAGSIDPYACRSWAEQNFSLDRVGEMFDEYFWSVARVHDGKGWYEPNPERPNLNWLFRVPPSGGTAERRGIMIAAD